MALTSNDERRSMRRVMRNEAKEQVLALGVTYGEREVILQIECINQEYCTEHAEDVQAAVSQFITEANTALADAGCPEIK